MAAISEQLTERFYAWEQRGRGWHVFPFPVELEPEFHPFYGHFLPTQRVADDSRRHTLFSGIASLFSSTKREPVPDNSYAEIPPLSAYEYDCDEPLLAYSIVLPKDEKLAVEDVQQLLIMLSYTEHPVSFEIVGTQSSIGIQIACRESDAAHVSGQVKAYFPTAILTENDEGLDILTETNTVVIPFGLSDEFMRPLSMAEDIEQDPYIGLFATLEQLLAGERGVIQILFKGAVAPWAESVMRSVKDNNGKSFFENAPEMVKLAEEKVASPLFGVIIRVAGQSPVRNKSCYP